MTIRRPRRIFRDQPTYVVASTGMGRTLMAGLIGTLFGAFVVMLALPSDLFGRVPPPSGSISAEAKKVAVIDGDTLRLADNVIRLQGLEAPPRGKLCQRANGTTFDCGAAAVDALANMVRGREVTCHIGTRDSHGFTEAMCNAGDTNLNRQLVADGWARARADAPAFGDEENRARNEQRGLWRGGSMF